MALLYVAAVDSAERLARLARPRFSGVASDVILYLTCRQTQQVGDALCHGVRVPAADEAPLPSREAVVGLSFFHNVCGCPVHFPAHGTAKLRKVAPQKKQRMGQNGRTRMRKMDLLA